MNETIKLLYVDDEIINLKLFEINFKKKFEVLTANNGNNGMDLLEKNPDILIIISDMKMPNMNGLEFIEKAKRKYPKKKYFILTGFEITSEIQEAMSSGLILKYFSKPFNYNEIDSTIDQVVN